MNSSDFLNEQLWPGQLGNILILLALCSAIFGAIAHFRVTLSSNLDSTWKNWGRIALLVHSSAVFGIVALLFGIMLTRQFEYYYVWKHTNTALPQSYIFAAFWEGQEGSFLLWAFWHAVIGLVFLHKAFRSNSGVIATLLLVQGFLMTMLLGRIVFIPEWGIDFNIGSFPFGLTREHPTLMNAPFTKLTDYLLSLDGRGLNPALQNYWMTIHPPTLFLGFALTTIPFGFVIQALIRRDFSSWFRTALPWAFLGVGVLGAGILMGGAWAYEALSFGGFWVWDPVENASLVPWLLLTAGGHMLLIQAKNRAPNPGLCFPNTWVYYRFVFYLPNPKWRFGRRLGAFIHRFGIDRPTPSVLVFLYGSSSVSGFTKTAALCLSDCFLGLARFWF